MAIDTGSLMLKLSPLSPINIGAGSGMGLERQRLALAREQFENTKKQQDATNRQHQLEQAGLAEQRRLTAEKDAAERAALVTAQAQKDKLAAIQKFGELNGQGDIEGGQAMIPLLSTLGVEVDNEGDEHGLPRYRIDADPEKSAEGESQAWEKGPHPIDDAEGNESAQGSLGRLGELGYPSDEQGALEEPPGIGTTEDAFAQAQAASQSASEAGGLAARAPDEPDYAGAVPKNVIDMGAIQAQTLSRLNPALKGLVDAYPDEASRASAQQTADGLRDTGLPLDKQLAAFDKLRGGADARLNTLTNADAQKEKFRATQDELSTKDKLQFRKAGFNAARARFNDQKMQGAVDADRLAEQIKSLLVDDDSLNDMQIGPLLLELSNVKGTPSDTDLNITLGIPKASLIDKAVDTLGTWIQGGIQAPQKQALLGYVKKQSDSQKKRLFGYLGDLDEQIGSNNLHPEEAVGARNFRSTIPKAYRDEYEATRKKSAPGAAPKSGGQNDPEKLSPTAGMNDFDIELEGQALENDLSPEGIRAVMGPESGGRADAKNASSGATGIGQFLPSTAKGLGTSVEELAKMTPSEQIPYLLKYYKGHGLTSDSPPEDYALATAAPAFIGKPPETVVYAKGSKAWEQNAPWRPKDGGDITVGSILAFYGLGGGKGGSQAKAAPANESPADKRARELLEKMGGR